MKSPPKFCRVLFTKISPFIRQFLANLPRDRVSVGKSSDLPA